MGFGAQILIVRLPFEIASDFDDFCSMEKISLSFQSGHKSSKSDSLAKGNQPLEIGDPIPVSKFLNPTQSDEVMGSPENYSFMILWDN